MKKILLSSVVLLMALSMILSFSLAGCKTTTAAETTVAGTTVAATTAEATTEATTTTAAGSEKPILGVSYYTSENPILLAIIKGTSDEGTRLGYDVHLAEANMNAEKQLADIENFIQLGAKLILINPLSSAGIVPAIKECNAAGIPVVMLDIDAPEGEKAAFVTSDNDSMGRFGGEYLAWQLNGKGNLVLFDYPELDIVRQRTAAFNKVLSYFPEMKIVATEIAVIRQQGIEKMETILQANPDIDGVYAINDGGGLGAFFAARAAGKEADYIIAAVDADPEAVVLIETGTAYKYTTAHNAKILGKIAVSQGHKVVMGEKVEYKTVIPAFPLSMDRVATWRQYGSLSPKLPPLESLIPSWYQDPSWIKFATDNNYNDWKNTESYIKDLVEKLKATGADI